MVASTMSVAGTMRFFCTGVSFSSRNPPSILLVVYHIPLSTCGVPEARSNWVRLVRDWAGTGVAVGTSVASVFCVGGDLVVVELKSGRTPREVTAQALDQASWAKALEFDDVVNMADG